MFFEGWFFHNALAEAGAVIGYGAASECFEELIDFCGFLQQWQQRGADKAGLIESGLVDGVAFVEDFFGSTFTTSPQSS